MEDVSLKETPFCERKQGDRGGGNFNRVFPRPQLGSMWMGGGKRALLVRVNGQVEKVGVRSFGVQMKIHGQLRVKICLSG